MQHSTLAAIKRHARSEEEHIHANMVRRIRSLESWQTKQREQLRKLQLRVEMQRQTIKKLRAQIRQKTTRTNKTLLKKPATKRL